MGNPTPKWLWQFPAENQEPWYGAFDTFATAIDLTVFSNHQQPLAPWTTVIHSLSAHANAQFGYNIVGSTTQAGAWQVYSFTPGAGGPLSPGSFQVVNSGSAIQLRTEFVASALIAALPAVNTNTLGRSIFYARLVIQPGSITTGDSEWIGYLGNPYTYHSFAYSVVLSLAPGAYSVTPEMRYITFNSSWYVRVEPFRTFALETRFGT